MENIDYEVRRWSVFVATLPEQENQCFRLIRICEIQRILHGKCWRTVFTHELLTYQKSNEWAQRTSKFLIQKQRVRKYRTKHFPCGIVFIIYILRHSSFWRPFYFKSFKNAKICRYTLTAKWQRKRSISFLVKTFVKNINDGKDMR